MRKPSHLTYRLIVNGDSRKLMREAQEILDEGGWEILQLAQSEDETTLTFSLLLGLPDQDDLRWCRIEAFALASAADDSSATPEQRIEWARKMVEALDKAQEAE